MINPPLVCHFRSSNATGAPVDDSHVDADQMDLGDELRKRDRPDPTGVGAALRMHWQECVKEETEKQLEAVRKIMRTF